MHSPNVDEGGMFDGHGRRAMLFPDDGHPDLCNAVLDLTGDCRDEIVVWDPYELWVYTQDDNPISGRLYKPVAIRFTTTPTTRRPFRSRVGPSDVARGRFAAWLAGATTNPQQGANTVSRTRNTIYFIALAWGVLWGWGSPGTVIGDPIDVTIQNALPMARIHEPITCGVPLVRRFCEDSSELTLLGPAGTSVPAQILVTNRYKDGSPRWVLLDFDVDVPAKGQAVYRLTANAAPCRPPRHWPIDLSTALPKSTPAERDSVSTLTDSDSSIRSSLTALNC